MTFGKELFWQKNSTKHLNTWCGKNATFSNIKLRDSSVYSCTVLAPRHRSAAVSTFVNFVSVCFFFGGGRWSPKRAMASSFTRILYHTQLRSTISRTLWTSDQPDAATSTRQHNSHDRQIFVPSAELEPTISEDQRPQTYALDCAAAGTGSKFCISYKNRTIISGVKATIYCDLCTFGPRTIPQ